MEDLLSYSYSIRVYVYCVRIPAPYATEPRFTHLAVSPGRQLGCVASRACQRLPQHHPGHLYDRQADTKTEYEWIIVQKVHWQ
jgi:hypothetical protein